MKTWLDRSSDSSSFFCLDVIDLNCIGWSLVGRMRDQDVCLRQNWRDEIRQCEVGQADEPAIQGCCRGAVS